MRGVVFYGSCLRKGTAEGVLDFYAIVDSYADAYSSTALTWLNRLLPPNVFYLDLPSEVAGESLKAKYAVLSQADFDRATSPGVIRSSTWARFCQPALVVWWRDEACLDDLVAAVERAVLTALRRLLPLLPTTDGHAPFESSAFWSMAFRETYRYETRPEADATIDTIFEAAPERFRRAALGGLAQLASAGELTLEASPQGPVVRLDPERRERAARSWHRRRPLARAVYALQLAKSALTFGDWLPYVLWKLQRHSGVKIEATERQRRQPWLYGWPVLFRVLRQKILR